MTQVAFKLRPFAAGWRGEILAQPKIYCFDTGFMRFARNWNDLRPEDFGSLWEHLLLDALRAVP